MGSMPPTISVSVRWHSSSAAVGLFVGSKLPAIFDLRDAAPTGRCAIPEDRHLFPIQWNAAQSLPPTSYRLQPSDVFSGRSTLKANEEKPTQYDSAKNSLAQPRHTFLSSTRHAHPRPHLPRSGRRHSGLPP